MSKLNKAESIARIATVLALFFAVSTYAFDLYRKHQVYLVTLEMAEKEAKINLSLIGSIRTWSDSADKTGLSPAGRFNTYFLQEVSKAHSDEAVRELSMDILVDLEQCNRMMDTLMAGGLTLWSKDQQDEIKQMIANIAKEIKRIANPLEGKYQRLLKALHRCPCDSYF